MKKTAFTLAEIVMTLSIIGVIATLMIPVVINSTGDKILKAQYKKAYVTLNDALAASKLEFPRAPECYYDENFKPDGNRNKIYDNGNRIWEDCTELSNKMIANLNVIKTYNNFESLTSEKPYYAGITQVPHMNCESFMSTFFYTRNNVYVLSDGMIIVSFSRNSDIKFRFVAVDINGRKKPNKWGYDLFTFAIKGDNATDAMYVADGCEIVAPGGLNSRRMYAYTFQGRDREAVLNDTSLNE